MGAYNLWVCYPLRCKYRRQRIHIRHRELNSFVLELRVYLNHSVHVLLLTESVRPNLDQTEHLRGILTMGEKKKSID